MSEPAASIREDDGEQPLSNGFFPLYKPGTRVCSTEASKVATLATPEVFIEAAMPSSACPEKEHQM